MNASSQVRINITTSQPIDMPQKVLCNVESASTPKSVAYVYAARRCSVRDRQPTDVSGATPLYHLAHPYRDQRLNAICRGRFGVSRSAAWSGLRKDGDSRYSFPRPMPRWRAALRTVPSGVIMVLNVCPGNIRLMFVLTWLSLVG